MPNPAMGIQDSTTGRLTALEGVGGAAKVFRPEDYQGNKELVEITTQTSTPAAVTLVGPAADGLKLVTIRIATIGTPTAELLYVAFPGTPFDDAGVAGLRHVLPIPAAVGVEVEKTFVFADVLPTGVELATNDAVGTGHIFAVEVTYV